MSRNAAQKKLFSGKKKKEQLKNKRSQLRGSNSGDDKGSREERYEDNVPFSSERLTTSFGASESKHNLNTMFVRESSEIVNYRRYISDIPIDTSLRDSPLRAFVYPPVILEELTRGTLAHPKGIVLRRGHDFRTINESIDTRTIEEEGIRQWLHNIYEKYPRESLNNFEHHLDVWMQLWHTVATSDIVCIVTDIRNPLWHLPPSLMHQLTTEVDKPVVVILNKIDLVPPSVVKEWLSYLEKKYPAVSFVPFSASGAETGQETSLGARRRLLRDARRTFDRTHVSRRAYHVELLLDHLKIEENARRSILENLWSTLRERQPRSAAKRRGPKLLAHDSEDESDEVEDEYEEEVPSPESEDESTSTDNDINDVQQVDQENESSPGADKPLVLGFIGHPNVGKSSIVNALSGGKKVSVSRTAGHTKRAQTIPLVPGKVFLLDCPGLVFPAPLGNQRSEQEIKQLRTGKASQTGVTEDNSRATRERRNTVDSEASDSESFTTPTGFATVPQVAKSADSSPQSKTPAFSLSAIPKDRKDYPTSITITGSREEERVMQECGGVLPIAQVREVYTTVRYLAEHLPLERMYGLSPDRSELQEMVENGDVKNIHEAMQKYRWSPLHLCEALATKRGIFVARVGRPDGHAAGREILYDAQDGVLPIYWRPPMDE